MILLELFAGMQPFATAARKLGWQTYTSDIAPLPGIDYVCDIMNFDYEMVQKKLHKIDVLIATPDCSTWSKAAGNTHYNSGNLAPKTEKAILAQQHINQLMVIIEYFLQHNPNMKYYIENPEGKLRMYLQPGTLFSIIPRMVVLDQCQYGREYQKTTHIFTNDLMWKPRQRCPERPICNHKPNLKNLLTGSKTSLGTMDNLRYYERATIPEALCNEILT